MQKNLKCIFSGCHSEQTQIFFTTPAQNSGFIPSNLYIITRKNEEKA